MSIAEKCIADINGGPLTTQCNEWYTSILYSTSQRTAYRTLSMQDYTLHANRLATITFDFVHNWLRRPRVQIQELDFTVST